MHKETDFERALRVKGYAIKDENGRKRIEISGKTDTGLKVKPTIISSVSEYISFISSLDFTYENPVMYRGHGNAEYPMNSLALRVNSANENRMLEAFSRNFPIEIRSCVNNMDRLALMQHFGVPTRAFDISENPLASLYFACAPMKKFNKNPDKEKLNWGEVLLFRDPETDRDILFHNIKNENSSKVSIISCTAFMEHKFSLWQLGMEWKKDNNYMREEKYITLKDILCQSMIVRIPMDNPRIKNQRGAFIMINANEIDSVAGNSEHNQEIFDYILSNEDVTFDTLATTSPWKKYFSGINTWDLVFKKVTPFAPDNKIQLFKSDPFDLQRLLYKDKKDVQQVVLIPPECKDSIIKDLWKLGITEGFIYPDMDNVAQEIKENLNV